MEAAYTDAVFGEMKYKHRWYKMDKIDLFGKAWEVTVAAKAYSGKPISDAQRNSYKKFLVSQDAFSAKISEMIMCFINQNCEELSATWFGARMVKAANDLSEIVRPRTLLFMQDGAALILLDCPWDEEHGLAVQFIPEFAIGSQDIFL